jgi:diguanylate cyclase
MGADHASAGDSRAEFHRSFRDYMAGIRNSMRETHDIALLKQAIEEGLDAIETQMTHYVRREEALTVAAAERIDALSSRLHDIKHEAFLLQQKMQEQRDLAMKDPLTGVFNRLAYEERLDSELQRWRRYQEPLSLVVIDVDHFKRINDTFGHLAGDKALKALSTRLVKNLREVDFVARYGGEEFVVIMPNTGADQAYRVAEKLRSIVAAAGFHYHQQPVNITVSCGVATVREGDDSSSLFQRADDAQYGAKQAGRNRTHREQAPVRAAQA